MSATSVPARPHELPMRKAPSDRRQKAAQLWRLLVERLMKLYAALQRWVNANKVVRECKFRAPALMGYMEAILDEETTLAMDLPPALPPASTKAKGQTAYALNLKYQEEPHNCPHLVEHGRRYGNAHGKFLECINCGSVWRGIDYTVPISQETVTTYKIYVGIRDKPGGKVMKGATTRRASSSKSSVYSSSSPPTSMEAAYGITYQPPRRATTKAAPSKPERQIKPKKEKVNPQVYNLEEWDDADMVEVTSEEDVQEVKTARASGPRTQGRMTHRNKEDSHTDEFDG